MTDDLRAKAQANLEIARVRVHQARAELARAEADIARWESFLASYSELVGDGDAMEATRPVPWTVHDRTQRRDQTSKRGGAIAETEETAIKIIRQHGRPMKTRELLDALVEAGLEIGGQDPSSTLSARLSRSPRIRNDRRLGWTIEELADDENRHERTSSATNPFSGPVEPVAGGGT